MESRKYLVVCMLLSLTQLTFSEDNNFWCNLQQDHSVHAVNGQNVSLSFNVADPFGDTQSLVWEKGDHNLECEKLNNRSLNCSTDESSNPGRYMLTQINGTSFDMFIAFTEQNDSGKHIVQIHQGLQQPLCTIVILNLTIEGTSPTCSTLINKESGKLQMACQWMQVNGGDHAQLLAGNQPVYEYKTPEMDFKGDLNLSHKLTAHFALQDIFMENILPSECVITNSMHKMKTRRVCAFPKYPILQMRQVLNQTLFKCLKCLHPAVISWRYTKGEFLIPDNITDLNPLVDDMQIAFLCGEEHDDFKMIIHHIWKVQFQEDQKCNISVSPKGRNSSAVAISCENTSENTSLNMSREEDNGTACNETETHLPLNDNDIALYSLAALSSVALTFSLCGCFAKCCKIFFRKKRYRLKEDLDQEALNTRNNENVDSVDMTVLSIDPQPRRVSELTHSAHSQCPSDENNHCANRDKSSPDWDLPNRPPTLPSRRHLVKRDKKCCDTSTIKQLRDDNACDTKITSKNNAAAGASSASNHDSTYCSVDDVQGSMTGIRASDSKSFLSSLPTSMTSGDYHGNYDLFNQKESSSPSADPDKRNLVINSHSDHTENPDSFYAQPDMSRKTKRMTSVESDYDDPRPPGEEYFQNILPERHCLESSVLNNDPTYGNYNTDPPTGSGSDI